MSSFKYRQIKFVNGERLSLVIGGDGLPVHTAALFINRFRSKGRMPKTIEQVCVAVASLHNDLARQNIVLVDRVKAGQFLTAPELERIADATKIRIKDLKAEDSDSNEQPRKVIQIKQIRLQRRRAAAERVPVTADTYGTRLRYKAAYLKYVADYYGSQLKPAEAQRLAAGVAYGLPILLAHLPRGSKREKLGARTGLSKEDQDRVLATVHPDSPTNPWCSRFVRVRNWLIVVLLLAAGIRRGELLGLQIGDFLAREPKFDVLRRSDAVEDERTEQPGTKTSERRIELHPAIMSRLRRFMSEERHAIKRARRISQLFTSDEGHALSESSIDALFADIRAACPGLSGHLTSHVMRHTWNERFSEEAEAMGLTDKNEEDARNVQQGWSPGSTSSKTYTRRHTERKGREVALRVQVNMEVALDDSGN